jgi:hypothetical protein
MSRASELFHAAEVDVDDNVGIIYHRRLLRAVIQL